MSMFYENTFKASKKTAANSKSLSLKQTLRVNNDYDVTHNEDDDKGIGNIDPQPLPGQTYQKKKFNFRESHPGGHFFQLAKLKNWVIPKV